MTDLDHLRISAEPLQSPWTALFSRPVVAAAVVLALGALSELPQLRFARVFSAPPARPAVAAGAASAEAEAPGNMTQGEAELGKTESSAASLPTKKSGAPRRGVIGGQKESPALPQIDDEEPPLPLTDPTGTSLDHFFAKLEQVQRKQPGAIARIAHFGDSMIVSDYVSGTLRRKLQETFGDAGHGYMLIANAWPAYFHNDVFRFATSGFRASRIVGPLTKDEMYGLGGVTFRAQSGLISQYGTAEKGDFGRAASRFTVSYLAQPAGGSIIVSVDGQERETIDTASETKVVKRQSLSVPDGEHRFQLAFKGGETRTFGVVLERDGPGVVLDALGVQGARIRFLDKQDDAHFADELKWRDPSLVVYQFGANESGDGYAYPMDQYLQTMKAVIAQGQAALPNASCLIIGAMDRARTRDGVTSSMKIIQLIIVEQEKAAKELGCAYFDTYESMGGWGSMPKWVKRGLGQADMTHPTGVGAERLGTWIYRALMKRYDEYLRRSRD